jgi:hypothetical protein
VKLPWLFLIALPLTESASHAQPRQAREQCLEPQGGIFDPDILFEHSVAHRKQLVIREKPFTQILLQMVKLPSFSAASNVALVRKLGPDGRKILGHVLVTKVGARREAAAPLDDETVRALLEVWKAAVDRSHYPANDRLGADGTMYHFWALNRGGQVWSPEEESTLAALVRLGDDVTEYPLLAAAKRMERAHAIRSAAHALVERMKAAPCSP